MSIIRPNPTFDVWEDPPFDDGVYRSSQIFSSTYAFQKEYLTRYDFELVRRPSAEIESQRLHCKEMMEVTSPVKKGESPLKVEEGEYSWYLQGNHVKSDCQSLKGKWSRGIELCGEAKPTQCGQAMRVLVVVLDL